MEGAGLKYDGYYAGASLGDVGAYGVWWSYTINSTNYSYVASVRSDNKIYPNDYSSKYFGRTVRYTIQILVLLIHYLWVWG